MPGPLDRAGKIAVGIAVAVGAGLIAFVLTLGPTNVALACSRSAQACVVRESWFFGARTRRLTLPLASIAQARVRPTPAARSGHGSVPQVLELVLRDGSSYPTIDFEFHDRAQRQVDAFNRYLADPGAADLALDSPIPAVVFALGGVLALGALLAVWRTRAARSEC